MNYEYPGVGVMFISDDLTAKEQEIVRNQIELIEGEAHERLVEFLNENDMSLVMGAVIKEDKKEIDEMNKINENFYVVYKSDVEHNTFVLRERNGNLLTVSYSQANQYDGAYLSSEHEVEVQIDKERNEEFVQFMGQKIYATDNIKSSDN